MGVPALENVSLKHTKRVLGGEVTVVFYDTTTMYFESREDDIRVPGYSKDGKRSNPQIVLGLLVGTGGNPIGYEIHKGNQYEGATLIPTIQKIEKRFSLSKPTVIADAGLLNKVNMQSLEADGYKYILGGRIKSMSGEDKKRILALNLKNGDAASLMIGDRRLIISMSKKRAKKDMKEREKGIKRLEKKFQSGTITKTYHRLINRIEAHVCICFAAYTIMLELERKLKQAGSEITLHRAMFLAEGIYEITYINPYNNKKKGSVA